MDNLVLPPPEKEFLTFFAQTHVNYYQKGNVLNIK